ncbi:MAG: L,D-transpeptidase family protein [Deltaproteobacteria bacterium]|nr:L,D-transpeptidase family protein [Deltaproteobacteria bacterium]MCB9478224.1 L,D-transpeptidase family protein [Deltaproteobacteria bacterium]MCB9487223.1 L,D-transpeptidase family protein [Deltaproteobacteria bacterium]
MGTTQSKAKRRPVAALGLALALVLLASACSLYYQQMAEKEVERLNLDFPTLIKQKIETDPTLAEEIAKDQAQRLADAAEIEPMLEKAYPLKNGAKYRFVENDLPSADHRLLIETLDSSVNDGLNPSNFRADALDKQAHTLDAYPPELDETTNVSLSPEQKAKLVQDLVEASKKKKDPELTGPAILDWMLEDERAAGYPEITAAYARARQLMIMRAKAEYNTEIDDAIAYFKYIRAMGLTDEMLLDNWTQSQTDMAEAVKDAAPNTPHYLRLRNELARYRKLAEKYPTLDHISIGGSTKYKKGSRNAEFIKTVQERLAYEDYYDGPINGVFDDNLEKSLVEYQQAHSVVDDGVIGAGTVQALNIPYSEKVARIRLTLSKMRKSESRWENYYLRVNIPEYKVEVVEDGKILRRHKVIVGNLNPLNNTPEFSAEVERVVYNPSWYMTRRIFKLEEYPKWEEDPEYFKKKGYVAHYNKEGIPVAAYQPPGPANALGRVKILFPNKHDVYLHDTPTKYLFNRTQRAFSHGCIRLHNPLEMAEFLLKKDGVVDSKRIEEILASRTTTPIELKHKVPIHIEYQTVSTNEDGRAVFLDDVYKRDVDLLAALDEPL